MHRLSTILHSGETRKKIRKTPPAVHNHDHHHHQQHRPEGCPCLWTRWSSSKAKAAAVTSDGPNRSLAPVHHEEEERGRTLQRGGSDRNQDGHLGKQLSGFFRGLTSWVLWCGPTCHGNGKQRASPEQVPCRRDSEPPPGNWLRNGSGSAERTHTNSTINTSTLATTTTRTPPAHHPVPRRMGKMQCLKNANKILRTPEGVYVNGELVVHPTTSVGGPSRNGLFRTHERPLSWNAVKIRSK
ncbi:hypothetical protein M406DRAFT_358700, partial [Cryphonectria parasitica EP155]